MGREVCLWLNIIILIPNEHVVSVLAISITTVALAEIGDKTQLLSLLLASRYRKPLPIIAAIFFATIANHALAAWLGVVVARLFISRSA